MIWGSWLIFAQQAAHDGNASQDMILGTTIIGGIAAAFTALWAMIRQHSIAAQKREAAMAQAIGEMEKWQRNTMQSMIDQNTRAMLTHAEAVEANTHATHDLKRATEELEREVHALRLGAEEREKQRKRRGKSGESDASGINL